MQVITQAVQSAQAVPTVTVLEMLKIQGLWLWSHSGIVIASVGGLWKLSRSIKKLPERITEPLSKRMDVHEKLDDEREMHVRTALADARIITDEKWDAMKNSIEQINLSVVRLMRSDSAD